MLLTSSQVGILLSSSIVVTFTTLLFYVGYFLQQQTLHSIQAVIRPPIPVPKHPPIPNAIPLDPRSRAARAAGNKDVRNSLQAFLSQASPSSINWSKLAYVQVVKSHNDVCSAVMLFASLHRLKSAPKRILMFPQAWATAGKGEVSDPYLETSLSLMRKAARRYRVLLQPMTTIISGADEMSAGSYSLASAFGLTDLDRILHLASPGIMLDPAPLDSLLAYAPAQPFAALPGLNAEAPSISDSLYLFRPSHATYKNFTETLSTNAASDFSLLTGTFPVPGAYFPDYLLPADSPIVATTSSLTLYSERSISTRFNATEFLSRTAWVRLWDPDLPGPEYDVPYHERLQVAPADENARIVWERLYSVYREDRMEVCGLDMDTFQGDYGAKTREEKSSEKKTAVQVEHKAKEEEVKVQIEGILRGERVVEVEDKHSITVPSGSEDANGILM